MSLIKPEQLRSGSYNITGSLFGTSSFALTASYALNAGAGNADTGSLLITASSTNAVITFTKGDGSTFPITINNVASASYAISSSLALNTISSSYAATASFISNLYSSNYTQSFTNQSTWVVIHNLDTRYVLVQVYDTNLKVLMNVLENIPKNSDTVFNFVSSWFVYGQNNEIPFREDYSHCNPTGFYSITKHCAEQMLISFCQTFNIKYRIFRLANVLGEDDTKISKKKNALQYLIKEITQNRDVELYYNGKVLRDYIYVNDVCDALKYCIDFAPVNQIINIGNGEPLIFGELIEKAIDYSKSSSKIIHIDPTQFHNIVQVRHSYLDTTKLKSYGFTSKYDIDTIIHKLVDFYKG